LPLPDSVITLGFSSDGVAAGNAGCNDYSGPYVADGTTLTVGPILATQQACSEELDAQEAAYLAALETVVAYADAGGQLSLVDGSGQEVLRFNSGPTNLDE
jgi:heat shock protein HslJ